MLKARYLALLTKSRWERQSSRFLFRAPNIRLESRGFLSSSSWNATSYRFSHSMHSAQSKVAQSTFSGCACGRSPTFAKRLVPRHHAEWNRRGLIGTNRRELRQRTAVGWTLWTLARRNGCVQTGRGWISDQRRCAGNEVWVDAGNSRQDQRHRPSNRCRCAAAQV